MITQAMQQFLEDESYATPYLLIDSQTISQQYQLFCESLGSVKCHFSVKSNSSPQVLAHLHDLGCAFEVASWGEIRLCLDVGIPADCLHFGNSVKRIGDVQLALDAGVPTFAFDCKEELDKLLDIDPNINLVCRVITDGAGAVWRLHDKFGCSLQSAISLCREAHQRGANVVGLSFHVGSQQRSSDAWCRALTDVEQVMSALQQQIEIKMVNIGGGFPASGYIDHHEHVEDFSFNDFVKPINTKIAELKQRFGQQLGFIAEPGRFITAQSGCIKSTVLLTTERFFHDHNVRWTYLDIGKFNGLYEASDVKLQAVVMRPASKQCVETMLAGPSCDSEDVLSLANNLHHLPDDIAIGDTIVFTEVGAYSTSYACVAFNGIKPLTEYFI